MKRSKAVATAAMMAALASVSKKHGENGGRDLLVGGDRFAVDLSVQASVDGRGVAFSGGGSLEIGKDTAQTKKIFATTDYVVAWLIERIPKSRRDEVLAEMAQLWKEGKPLEAAENTKILAKAHCDRLHHTATSPRSGAVKYIPATPKRTPSR